MKRIRLGSSLFSARLAKLLARRGPAHVPVKVYERVRSVRLSWFFGNGLGDALPCFFSARDGVEEVLLVVAPCTDGDAVRKWPRKWRWLEERVSRCDYEACTDPATGKPYPDYPGYERCIVIPGDDEAPCRIVYVADWDKVPELRNTPLLVREKEAVRREPERTAMHSATS